LNTGTLPKPDKIDFGIQMVVYLVLDHLKSCVDFKWSKFSLAGSFYLGQFSNSHLKTGQFCSVLNGYLNQKYHQARPFFIKILLKQWYNLKNESEVEWSVDYRIVPFFQMPISS
jgi:hypothetical protein